jgi:hypothetical protein
MESLHHRENHYVLMMIDSKLKSIECVNPILVCLNDTKKENKFIQSFKKHTRNDSLNTGSVVPFLISVFRLLPFDLSGNKYTLQYLEKKILLE